MSKNETWIINDLKKFIYDTRVLVYNNFGEKKDVPSSEENSIDFSIDEEGSKELDSILTQIESEVIAKNFLKKQKNKSTKEYRYTITSKNFMLLVESLNGRMVSNILNNLANKGVLETAYDSELNDFIFWAKDDIEEKPETD